VSPGQPVTTHLDYLRAHAQSHLDDGEPCPLAPGMILWLCDEVQRLTADLEGAAGGDEA
jgi:hypothetical protein